MPSRMFPARGAELKLPSGLGITSMRMGLQRIVGWASVPVGVAARLWMALLTTHPYLPGPGPEPAALCLAQPAFSPGVCILCGSNRGGHGILISLVLRPRPRTDAAHSPSIISVRGRRLYPRRVLVSERASLPGDPWRCVGVFCARYVRQSFRVALNRGTCGSSPGHERTQLLDRAHDRAGNTTWVFLSTPISTRLCRLANCSATGWAIMMSAASPSLSRQALALGGNDLGALSRSASA